MQAIRALLTGAALVTAFSVAAAGFTDPAEIDRAVARFTGSPIGAPGGARLPADRRLKLAACDQPLALEWYGKRRDSVLVRCPEAGGWRVFIPVASLAANAPAKQVAVARGENVTIAIEGQGFTLTRQGEALDGGAVGDWIRVRPADDRKADPMRARIMRPGQVGIALP